MNDSHDLAVGEASRIVLTTRERDMINLMIAGHSDDAIGRRLGLSKRTISYTVSGLMARLNVVTRFQLAWELSRRGMLHK